MRRPRAISAIRLLAAAALLLGLGACYPTEVREVTRAEVGSGGGVIVVTDGPLAGTTLAIPPGALPRTMAPSTSPLRAASGPAPACEGCTGQRSVIRQ